MSEFCFCLDIHEELLTGMRLHLDGKVVEIVGCAEASYSEGEEETAVGQILTECGYEGERCIVCLGGELCSFRNIVLPFKERHKIAQVLPFELSELSPFPMQSYQLDFLVGRTTEFGTESLSVLASKSLVALWLATLQHHGVDPEIISLSGLALVQKISESRGATLDDPEGQNFVMLDFGDHWLSLFVFSHGHIRLLRSKKLTTAAESENCIAWICRTLLACRIFDVHKPNWSFVLCGDGKELTAAQQLLIERFPDISLRRHSQSEQPLVKFRLEQPQKYRTQSMDRLVADALVYRGRTRLLNFRYGDFKKRRSVRQRRTLLAAAVLLPLLIAAPLIGYFGMEYRNLSAQKDQLAGQIEAVFSATVPDRIVKGNPVNQLDAKIRKIRETYKPGDGTGLNGMSMLDALSELSVRIPATIQVRFVRLAIDGRYVRIKAVTDNFNSVDGIQKELEKSSWFREVEIGAVNQSPDGEVRFDLKLSLNG